MTHDEMVEYLNSHHGNIHLEAQGFNWKCRITWWWKNSQSPIGCSISEVIAYGPHPQGAMDSARLLLRTNWAFTTERANA